MAQLEGTLSKWTNVMKGWQFRYFVLDENAGLLSYYTSKEKMMKGIRRGCVRLKDAVIGIDDQEDNTFTITVDHKTFHFQAQHSDEREKWVRRLEDTIRRHANRTRLWGSQSTLFVGGYNKDPSGKRANHLEILDKRVSEADAYLQLMIEQTNKIEKRILEISDPEEKTKCKQLQDNVSAMVDHIKHSIVTLQIAKNMAHPINGMYHGPTSSRNNSTKTESTNEDATEDGYVPQGGRNLQIRIGIELGTEWGTECEETNRQKDMAAVADATTAPLALAVPDTSYSSSEGEDDFYDANDDPFTSQGSSPMSCGARAVSLESTEDAPSTATAPTSCAKKVIESADSKPFGTSEDDEYQMASNKEQRTTISPTGSIPLQSDGSIDYDALYEEDEDTTISMESHGSMVTHLLSQVKIGMDLTKVVLPTFILERRSLLEMYADYFAHPDLFLQIADLDDPRDRIVQVCRWYLSAYHAGRKSSIAKKPYNPILGEVFQCHWDIPDLKMDPTEVNDGPVPWCRRDQLTFLAEQVSHHPPISAFYAEHYNKKITFCAHVWTKSKFLGLSIGVHNIGQGIVTLVDHNEEYFLTFPNGYGRSILTVPWIELGGSVEIKSPQTGYHANIEFLTKPFYGGKRNRITAEIYGPNEKKAFVTVNGEWSGLMEAKWHDPNKNKAEVFVDVNQIPIFKKKVRPIVKQEEYESRRVWKEVTAGLKFNDIEKATKAKFEVEQRQRDAAKGRKDTEDQWEQKFFKPDGDNWSYKKPLGQRLNFQEHETKR